MSDAQANVELVQRFWEALRARDFAASARS